MVRGGGNKRAARSSLVFTYRGEKIRPITAWDAGKDLKQFYFRTVGKTHG